MVSLFRNYNSLNKIYGEKDLQEEFHISGKLYGREKEVDNLLDSFEKVTNGGKEMVIVSGYSGIGKTRLVSEIYHPILEKKGYFISGNCDKFNSMIPYYPIIQAFRDLINQILTEDEYSKNLWKEELLKVLGVNGQVIVDVIPEVKLIIGTQPLIQTLPAQEAANRFIRVFVSFINVFTKKERPLVLFLDDLQWADNASLKLLEIIMTDIKSRYLFIIGCYQINDNKGFIQPLKLILESINQAGVMVKYIKLQPLDYLHINQLILDTLQSTEEIVDPLSEMILAKTNGNPIFINEFLKALYDKKVLKYNLKTKNWYWNKDDIQAFGQAENVIDIITDRFSNLKDKTKNVLKMAACIGNEFSLSNLSVIYEKTKSETFNDLLQAIEQGIITTKGSINDLFYGNSQEEVSIINSEQFDVQLKFFHYRIQHAVSLLIPEEAKKGIHFIIGKLIYDSTKLEDRQTKVFEIINHLNIAKDLINNRVLKLELAQLNLIAARKAKASTAYDLALEYSNVGINLLTSLSWKNHYELTFNLYLERAECEFLNINYEKAEELFELLLRKAIDDLEKIKIYNLRINLYINLGKIQESVSIGLEALRLLGINISPKPNFLKIISEIIKAKVTVGSRKIKDLEHLPELNDPYKKAIVDVLMALTPIAYLINQNFFVIIVMKIVNLSLKYGNSNVSAFGYGVYGLLLGSGFGKYKDGYEFGKLGLVLKEKFQKSEINSKCSFNFGWFLNHWRVHANENVTYLKKGIQEGLDAGDLVYASFCSASLIVVMNSKGDNLDDLNIEAAKYYSLVKYIKNEMTGQPIKLIQQMILNLKGLSENHLSLNNKDFNEAEFEKEIQEVSIKALFYIIKMKIAYLYGNYSQALLEQKKAKKHLSGAMGTIYTTDYYFYYSLVLTAIYPKLSPSDKIRCWLTLNNNKKKMKQWVNNCPENFYHKYSLITAEMAAIKGNWAKAVELYDDTISSAQENGYNHITALGYELAGTRYLARNEDIVSYRYLASAKNAYIKWGAIEKANLLASNYQQLFIKYNPNSSNDEPSLESIITCTEDNILS